MSTFSEQIIHWYQQNKRDLPWRHTRDPYVIWLSEVILQQTRVDQGLPYFHRFLERFPRVEDFAGASEDEILRLWQGLGYYSRARNMHQAAKTVLREHHGRFPSHYTQLLQLKGVGEYTAAAIASFAADEAQAVVDGNVFRVLSRYFGIATPINSSAGKKEFGALAQEVLNKKSPGLHNQAMMEFGALHCTPKKSACFTCPLRLSCTALATDQVNELPVKLKSKPPRHRIFHYLLYRQGDQVLVNKRGPGDIWQNLYELPLIEDLVPTEISALPVTKLGPGSDHFYSQVDQYFGPNAQVTLLEGPVKHVLSHQHIRAFLWSIHVSPSDIQKKDGWNYVDTKDLDTLAKPKLIVSLLEGVIID